MKRTAPISLSDLSPKVRGQATRQILAQIKSKEDVAEVPVKSAFPSIRAPFEFSIPVPPSVNHLFATVGKRRIKSKKYKAWLEVAGWKIKDQSLGGFELHSPWWISGIRCFDDAQTMVAAVRAPDEAAAKAIILAAYDDRPKKLEWRFCTEMNPLDTPFSDRFPQAKWMKW